MRVAVFPLYAYGRPHFETELEIIQRHLDAGDEVVVWTCEGQLSACDGNPQHSREGCHKCTARREAGLGLLTPGVVRRSFYALEADDLRELDTLPTAFESADALKAFRVDNFDIGYAVLSSVVTLQRDPDVDLAAQGLLVRALLRSAWIVYRSVLRLLAAEAFDCVYIFNGRLAPLRAVLRACERMGVMCRTHERGRDLRHYSVYENALPHDLDYVHGRIEQAWRAAADNPRRAEVAAAWYEGRAAGQITNWRSYVADQRAALLPANWDLRRRNIVVFPSSEDEFEAIGDSWRLPFYRHQLDGIRALAGSLAAADSDLHLYVRVHPNLATVHNRRTQALCELRGPRLTVIQPTAKVSTYAMLREADKVVTFGSTTGMEAVYWGKPSVLLGRCFYVQLGGTYQPRDHQEAVHLLNASLTPQPVEPALRYGFYWATVGEPFRYFQPEGIFRGRFRGRRVRAPLWSRALGYWNRLHDQLAPRRPAA